MPLSARLEMDAHGQAMNYTPGTPMRETGAKTVYLPIQGKSGKGYWIELWVRTKDECLDVAHHMAKHQDDSVSAHAYLVEPIFIDGKPSPEWWDVSVDFTKPCAVFVWENGQYQLSASAQPAG